MQQLASVQQSVSNEAKSVEEAQRSPRLNLTASTSGLVDGTGVNAPAERPVSRPGSYCAEQILNLQLAFWVGRTCIQSAWSLPASAWEANADHQTGIQSLPSESRRRQNLIILFDAAAERVSNGPLCLDALEPQDEDWLTAFRQEPQMTSMVPETRPDFEKLLDRHDRMYKIYVNIGRQINDFKRCKICTIFLFFCRCRQAKLRV